MPVHCWQLLHLIMLWLLVATTLGIWGASLADKGMMLLCNLHLQVLIDKVQVLTTRDTVLISMLIVTVKLICKLPLLLHTVAESPPPNIGVSSHVLVPPESANK